MLMLCVIVISLAVLMKTLTFLFNEHLPTLMASDVVCSTSSPQDSSLSLLHNSLFSLSLVLHCLATGPSVEKSTLSLVSYVSSLCTGYNLTVDQHLYKTAFFPLTLCIFNQITQCHHCLQHNLLRGFLHFYKTFNDLISKLLTNAPDHLKHF